ncbi:helix-turn-helix transcriptional regulator [Nonomuraea pusilla]|uniref:helix-turn-helix domain-containing protein n=1 Tax=Nonomuraea pusilla TaxID=46177 RepID=UPI0033244842
MKPHERLNEAMNDRRLELRLTWKQVAATAGISVEALGAIRRGAYRPTDLTARGLDDALQWNHGTVLGFYPDDERRGGRRPQEPRQEADHDDEIDLDTFVPESPAEKALMALYRARKQEEANRQADRQAIQEQLAELTKKLDEQSRKIEELRAEQSQKGGRGPRRSA